MSDLERREAKSPDRDGGNRYLFMALGLAFVAVFFILGQAVTFIASWPFLIAAAVMLSKGLSEMRRERRSLPPPINKERELLSAIRDSGGSITPAEAAMETSLTVREADGMLSELASSGHLAVESRNGTLFYALPGRGASGIEG